MEVGVCAAVRVASFPLTGNSTSSEIGNLALTGVELEAQLTESRGKAAQVGCNRRLVRVPSSRSHGLRSDLSLYDGVDC